MRGNADNIRFALTPLRRLKGLIGLQHLEGVLLLAPCHDIHTFGMQMNIDVAFIDADGKVLCVEADVPPRKRIRCCGALVVLERQASAEPWFQAGDALCLDVANSP